MSDSDSVQRRRPPTIDLTAQEVKAEEPTDANESPAAAATSADGAGQVGANAHSAGYSARRAAPYLFAGLIGAAAAAVIVGLWPGVAPQRGNGAPQSAAGPMTRSTEVTEIEARLEKIQGALQSNAPGAGMATRITDMEMQTKALGDSVAALAHRVDEIAVAGRDAAAEAKTAVAAAQDAKTAVKNQVQSGDLDQITRRIAALEQAVKALSGAARGPTGADDRVARAAVAAAALAAAVERGVPFGPELASVTVLSADENAIKLLTPFAADGLPSATVLSRELTQLLPSLRQAVTAAPKDGSLIARLEINAQKLVRITRTDSAAMGAGPSAIIARIEAEAREGDVAGALADIGRLPAQPRALADDWVKRAEAREAATAASRHILAEAVAALGKPTSQ